MGPVRRKFWEQFSNLAFARAPSDHEMGDLQGLLNGVANAQTTEGRVTLVGAGPGDPELMSVKAHRLLRGARYVAYFRKEGRAGRARTSPSDVKRWSARTNRTLGR